MIKFIIIGSGRRVQQDVLPSLSSINVKKNEILIYANRERKILVRDDNYEVQNLKKLKFIENNSIVYIAVTKSAVESVTDFIINLSSTVKIIIDTPIYSRKFIKKYSNSNICVAEDAFFLGRYLTNYNITLSKFNVLVLHKSAMSYHGIAFIESLFDKIFFQFSFFYFHLGLSKKGISIIYGKKNYEKGNIYLNFNKIKFPILNENEIKLIGGRSDYDNLSYRFLDLKRIGLAHLLNDLIKNEKGYISLKDGYRHYKNGETIGKSPLFAFLKKFK